MAVCVYNLNFDDAYRMSSAIFLGQVVETKKKTVNTTHHGEFEYWDAKFKVSKSWKLIDKQYVWVDVGTKKLECGQIEEGKTYLIFAYQSSKDLEVLSRSMSINDEFAEADLQLLGIKTLPLDQGEFYDYNSLYLDVSIALSITLVCAIFVWLWVRKQKV
jgi:hypothetical protein